MNDPRGILEEFVERSSYAVVHLEGLDANLEPECLRAAYRNRNEARGICRSCTKDAKPGRKYCPTHLAKANERAKRSARATASRSQEGSA